MSATHGLLIGKQKHKIWLSERFENISTGLVWGSRPPNLSRTNGYKQSAG